MNFGFNLILELKNLKNNISFKLIRYFKLTKISTGELLNLIKQSAIHYEISVLI